MARDAGGLPLREGDEVTIRARVVHLFPNEAYCNLQVETLAPLWPGSSPVEIVLNTRQVERAPHPLPAE